MLSFYYQNYLFKSFYNLKLFKILSEFNKFIFSLKFFLPSSSNVNIQELGEFENDNNF